MRLRRFRYSVSEDEAARFVADNRCISEFLNIYEPEGVTFGEKAMGLARFFRWLKVDKGVELAPSDFLNTHLRKTKADSVSARV